MAALFFGTLASLILSAVVYCLISSIRQNSKIGDIPGPSLAAFSNLWLMYQCRRGRRYLAVDAAHKKYGKFVRIQPNHVSIADADAISIIYGHGGGWLKRYLKGFSLHGFLLTFDDSILRVFSSRILIVTGYGVSIPDLLPPLSSSLPILSLSLSQYHHSQVP